MNVLDWLIGRFSNRGRALSLYQRGMARAKKRDHQGAINDYTAAIGGPAMPDDVKSMILYNRALVHAATGDAQKATDDLDAVLSMGAAPVNVVTMARTKLAKIESRSAKCKL